MTTTTTQPLHIELRPWSGCARCGQDIDPEANPHLNAPTFATLDRDSVCDPCAEKEAPAAFPALALVRDIEDAYERIAHRAEQPETAKADALAYLRTIAQGLAEVMAYAENAGHRVPGPAAWEDCDESHREWAVLRYAGETTMVRNTGSSRRQSEQEIEAFENWHDTDGQNPRPDFKLHLVYRQVGPWRTA